MSPIEQQFMLVSENIISVSQAAKLTPYSAGYLSLMARKGKLQAFKLNRDWVTTPQAVLEYVEKQKIKHSKIIENLSQTERRLS